MPTPILSEDFAYGLMSFLLDHEPMMGLEMLDSERDAMEKQIAAYARRYNIIAAQAAQQQTDPAL